MKISSIELTNFRQFKHEKIEFACDPSKNITIIMGKNGVGKTTFTQAFHWCFYGETNFTNKDLINYDVATALPVEEQENVEVKINVEFGGEKYTVSRLETYEKYAEGKLRRKTKTGKSPKIVSYDRNITLINEDAEELVEKMLPRNLAKYFFFDGEDMSVMSEVLFNKLKSDDIARVIQSIVGLNSLQHLIKHLKLVDSSRMTVIKRLNLEIDATGGDELQFLTADIELLEDELKKNEEERDNISKAISKNRQEDADINLWLENHKSAVELQKEIMDIEQEIKEIRKVLCKKEEGIRDVLNHYRVDTSLNWLFDLVKSDPAYIEPSTNRDNQSFKISKGLLESILNNGKCICGCDLSKDDERRKLVEKLTCGMEEDGLQRDFSFFMNLKEKFDRPSISEKAHLQTLIAEYDRIENTLLAKNQKIEDLRIEMAGRDDEIKEMIQKQDAYRAMIVDLEFRNEKMLAEKIEKEKKLREAENTRHQLVEKDSANQIYRECLQMAEEIYNDVKAAYSSVEGKVRIRFKECFQELYREIWDGPNAASATNRLHFNISDRYELIPSKPLDPSVGQKNSLVLSFIGTALTLAKEKNFNVNESEKKLIDEIEQYPLVMDAPLSAFDTDRITNIANVIPNIAQQWIIFIKDTDGNILSQEVKEKVGKDYRLIKYGDSEAVVKGGGI